MTQYRQYMAASVPRFLRQSKLGYLPLAAVIGSRITQGDGGTSMIFDIIMLPVRDFQRMGAQVGLQHVIAPTPTLGPAFSPSFVLADKKHIIVPEHEPDPEAYARQHFLKLFGLDAPQAPDPLHPVPEPGFSDLAAECTKKDWRST